MKPRRFDPLDSARATMMLLGVFVHTALILPLFYPDLSALDRTIFASIYQVIHIFRMPVFFLLAGIFASALLQKSGYQGFLISRFKRIVSVLIVAEMIIAAVLLPQGCIACSVTGSSTYLNNAWLHLWFLFYLALISHFFLAITNLWEKIAKDNYKATMDFLARYVSFNPLSVLALAPLTLLIPNYIGADGALKMTFALIPNLSLLAVFSLFYLVGWISFFRIEQSLANLKKYSWVSFLCGLVLGLLAWSYYQDNNSLEPYAYTLGMWFLTFGLVGFFVKYVPFRNKFFGFFTDASYWIYLWHPIFILLFAFLGKAIGIDVWLSFGLTSLLSLLVVSATYKYWVQDTLVDKWISGRRRRELVLNEKAGNPLMQQGITG